METDVENHCESSMLQLSKQFTLEHKETNYQPDLTITKLTIFPVNFRAA